MADQTPEPPFVRHLRELVDTGAALPPTDARRHHYVPSFLLARWATPQRRKGKLATLTVATGHTAITKPDNARLEAMDAAASAAEPKSVIGRAGSAGAGR